MYDFQKVQNVRSRKEYRCRLCGLRIRRGALHPVASGLFDGSWYRDHYHAVCASKTIGWDATDWETSSGCEVEFRTFDLGLHA